MLSFLLIFGLGAGCDLASGGEAPPIPIQENVPIIGGPKRQRAVQANFLFQLPDRFPGPQAAAGPAAPSLTLTFQEALEHARINSPQLQSATIIAQLAREDLVQAKAALLPSVNYFSQSIYTQGNGNSTGYSSPMTACIRSSKNAKTSK